MKKIFTKIGTTEIVKRGATCTIYGEFYFMIRASTTQLPTADDLRRALAERVREFVQRVRKCSERVSEGLSSPRGRHRRMSRLMIGGQREAVLRGARVLRPPCLEKDICIVRNKYHRYTYLFLGGVCGLGTPWFWGFGGFTKKSQKSSKIPLFSKNPKNPKNDPLQKGQKREKRRRRRLLIGRKIGTFLTLFVANQSAKFFFEGYQPPLRPM
jgi:hypothetical protein